MYDNHPHGHQLPITGMKLQRRQFYYTQFLWCLRVLLVGLIFMAGYLLVYWHQKIVDQRGRADLHWQDGTGRRDFASRFSGGHIIESLTTFAPGTPIHPAFLALDKTLESSKCWHVNNTKAQVGIKFARPVIIEQASVDDIPKELLSSPELRIAVREMSLWGIKELIRADVERSSQMYPSSRPTIHHPMYDFIFLRKLEYNIKANNYIQTFDVGGEPRVFDGIVVEVLSNWGGINTRLCRVRIHGKNPN